MRGQPAAAAARLKRTVVLRTDAISLRGVVVILKRRPFDLYLAVGQADLPTVSDEVDENANGRLGREVGALAVLVSNLGGGRDLTAGEGSCDVPEPRDAKRSMPCNSATTVSAVMV